MDEDGRWLLVMLSAFLLMFLLGALVGSLYPALIFTLIGQ